MSEQDQNLENVKSTRIFALVNQKGGVGKTTTAINLGTALAAVGKSVLLVDLDPQGNASTGFGITADQREISTYHVLVGANTVEEGLQKTDIPNLMVLPSGKELSGADIELLEAERRTHRLRDALRNVQNHHFDFILIDCPPSLNLLTINAMTSSDAVLVPLQCEFFALEGLSQLLSTVQKVKKNLNPDLAIQGVILTMFDKRNNLSEQVAEDVREYLGDTVYETVIPRNVRLSEAPSHAMPALIYDHTCLGSKAYIKLASELLKREAAL